MVPGESTKTATVDAAARTAALIRKIRQKRRV